MLVSSRDRAAESKLDLLARVSLSNPWTPLLRNTENVDLFCANGFMVSQEKCVLPQSSLQKLKLNIHDEVAPLHRVTYNCVSDNFLSEDSKNNFLGVSSTCVSHTNLAIEDSRWNVRFQELLEYKSQHGDCDVPHRYAQNRQLGGWVQKQRNAFKNEKLPSHRFQLLDGVGFSWVMENKKVPKIKTSGIHTYDDLWNYRYNQLADFKIATGHVNVPYRYKENLQLGRWTQNQREFNKRKILSEERIAKLNRLGFIWYIKKGPLEKKTCNRQANN